MRRHVLTRTAVFGSLLGLAACADADTIEGNDADQFVKTASVEHSLPDAEPANRNGKASMFGVPREARILFW
jgi:hypothetical protein